ncbi:MAG: hypothetical protein FWH47_01375 [Methanomassiliicoccaceae archaeon]|nr:hypothetical protein [Methanomassiliicoccaceae archaeon]
MTKPGAGSLIAAAVKARNMALTSKRFNANGLKDRTMVQNGCFLLNHWGAGPGYDYRQYVRGPFSTELYEDYEELRKGRFPFNDHGTEVDDALIRDLSEVMSKGAKYLEAYTAMIVARKCNPNDDIDTFRRFVLSRVPELREEVEEVLKLPGFQ